jgi:hypothetical protein
MSAVMPQPSVAPPSAPPEPVVMQDGSDETPKTPQYGENNETLPPEIQAILLSVVEGLDTANMSSRRERVKVTRRAREFWNANQYQYWSEVDATWKTPSSTFPGGSPGQVGLPNEDPPFQFVTNMYRGNGQTFSATVTGSTPSIKFWPQDPKQSADMNTAKAAERIARFIERNNRMPVLLSELAYYVWNDAQVGAYVRFVRDGEQFGWDEQPIMGSQPQQITPDQYACPQCASTQPAPLHPETGIPAAPPMPCPPGEPGQPPCPPMGPENFQPAQIAQVPVQTGVKRIPKGQEVIDFVGSLEMVTPGFARKLRDFPFIGYDNEQHVTKLKALFPNAAQQIATSAGDTGGEAQTDRNARIQTMQGIIPNDTTQLVTFRRRWLRPYVFESLEPGQKAQVQAIFQDGCYVAFAGKQYCESRNESMDAHWRVMSPVVGESSAGHDIISLQERLNTLLNIEMETYEHGIPMTLMAAEAMNSEALRKAPPRPGYITPVPTRAGLPVNAQITTQQAGQVSPQAVEHARDLMGPTAQFIGGLFPALFGGGMVGNDTASGYAMQRDQAMGRIGLVYRRIKEFYAEVMLLAVETFRKNRKGSDVAIAVLGPGAQFDADTIHVDDLEGSIYAYPETDEDYPVSWTQKKNAVMELLASQNPAIQAWFGTPAGASALGRITGLGGDISIPGADARSKQYREVSELLKSAPLPPAVDPNTGAPALDPVTGMPAQPTSTIPVDEILDDHQTEYLACQEWSQSDEGQTAKAQNPAGYENVRLHAAQHRQLAMAAMAPPPEQTEGEKPDVGAKQ